MSKNNIAFSTIAVEAAKAIGWAVVVNLVLYFALDAAGMFDHNVVLDPKSGQKLSHLPIVISTVFSMTIGTLVFWALTRFSANPGKAFTWVCIGVFVLTLGNPFFAGFPTKFAVGLDLLHIAPAYCIWRFLSRLGA
jgi:hypothetical protein